MGIIDRNGVKYLRTWIKGKEILRSLGTNSPAVAKQRAKDLEDELWRQQKLKESPRKLFDEAMLHFLDGYCRVAVKPSTLRRYEVSAKALTRHFTGKYLDEFNRALQSGFVDARRAEGVDDPTIRRDLSCLSSMFREAVNRDWAPFNPVRDFDKRGIKESSQHVAWLTQPQLEALMKVAPYHLARMIVVAIETGMRYQELATVTYEQVILVEPAAEAQPATATTLAVEAKPARWAVSLTETKNDRPRIIPLTDLAHRIIIEGKGTRTFVFSYGSEDKPIGSVKTAWRTARRKAGIPKTFRWHDLRHHAATMWRKSKMVLDRVKELLGHQDIQTTMRYAHIDATDLVDAMSAFEQRRRAPDQNRIITVPDQANGPDTAGLSAAA